MNSIEILLLLLFPLVGSVRLEEYPEILTLDEELHYVRLLKFKNEEARLTLIEHNLRLVAHIVKKFDNVKESKDDLLQIGSFGLIKAIDTYNLDCGVRLATYASKCIENEILMHLRKNKKTKNNVSIYKAIGADKEGNEIRIIDVLEDNSLTSLDSLVNKERIDLINESLETLNLREYEIISERYGLNGKKILTQNEISKKYNISRSYVSRIEKRALTKMYLYIKEKGS